MKKAKPYLALSFLFLLSVCGPVAADAPPGLTDAPTGGAFTLRSDAGPLSLQQLKGKVVPIYFGYTSCPDVCPTSLALLSQALDGLDEGELQHVQPLFITLDPERDSAGRLADYVTYFHPSIRGLTGSVEQIARVASAYGVRYYRAELQDSALGYAVNHSSATYLVNMDGKLQFLFPHETPPEVIREAIRYLLNR